MDLRKLKTLIDLVSESNVSELEITEADGKVRIVKAGATPIVMAAPVMQQAATQMPAMYVISFITVRLNVGQGMAAATMLLLPIALVLIIRAIVTTAQARRRGINA